MGRLKILMAVAGICRPYLMRMLVVQGMAPSMMAMVIQRLMAEEAQEEVVIRLRPWARTTVAKLCQVPIFVVTIHHHHRSARSLCL
jgi:hypothetical protein